MFKIDDIGTLNTNEQIWRKILLHLTHGYGNSDFAFVDKMNNTIVP